MRAAGVPVELETDDLGDLPAGVSLGIYRIVQESLTNTLKHAGRGATAAVRVHRTGDLVEVLVSDDGAGRIPQLAATGAAQRLPGRQRPDRHARTRARVRRDPGRGPGSRWWVAGPRGPAG